MARGSIIMVLCAVKGYGFDVVVGCGEESLGRGGLSREVRAREEGRGWDRDIPGRAIWRWVANSGKKGVMDLHTKELARRNVIDCSILAIDTYNNHTFRARDAATADEDDSPKIKRASADGISSRKPLPSDSTQPKSKPQEIDPTDSPIAPPKAMPILKFSLFRGLLFDRGYDSRGF
ncbi:unnamed protein product [Ilex paraguariensis]|uniref:Uncharacterized protein n=1 Tax=Ilex paraguariensis TaxID=185542 RepID=A0ABC8UIA8_9AQUA